MNNEILQLLIEKGYADEAGIAAEVTDAAGKNKALCVNGEVVTLVSGDGADKEFSDSIDRLENLTVKSGLFKKTIAFTHNGTDYAFTVKGGKTLIEYFKMIG
ncbi:MAG: hypothetical protein HDT28_05245 [Clostridiales bacterium]|nr:hypothetical protein [Clostridiales bacterium]